MPDYNDILTPTPFKASLGEDKSNPTAGEGKLSRRLIYLISGLACIMLFVILWLPSLISQDQNVVLPLADTTKATNIRINSRVALQEAQDTASPWADAALKKSKQNALELTAEAAEIKSRLEKVGAATWAPDTIDSAELIALNADKAYRAKEYGLAAVEYEKARDVLLALEASVPERLEKILSDLRLSIDDGDIQKSEYLYSQASLLDPANSRLTEIDLRMKALPLILAALGSSQLLERQGRLEQAVSKLQEAEQLDPEHPLILGALETSQIKLTKSLFDSAMSLGYQALEKNNLPAARQHFTQAKTLDPLSKEVLSAITELKESEMRNRLFVLRQESAVLESQENWIGAEKRFSEALKKDKNLLFANQGLARVSPRRALDQKLSGFIEDPEKLKISKVAQEADKTLATAKQIPRPGPRLKDQISTVATLLEEANTKLPVKFVSDGLTNITLYKIAELGRFDSRELLLRPGNYTAAGFRDGYRDIRISFDVSKDLIPLKINIKCKEAI